MKRPGIKTILHKLLVKIFLAEIAVLFVLLALAMTVVWSFKREMAANIADAFRTTLVMGDDRAVLMGMPGPALKYFSAVKWKPAQRASGISIPSDAGSPSILLYRSITVPLFSDENMRVPAGELVFFYKRWIFAGWALLAWACFLLSSLPLVLNERNRIIRNYRLMMDLQVKESLAAMAAQVAHDIRSPLAALDMAVKSSFHIPEEQRIIIRSAAARIRDIANNLLESNVAASPGAGETSGVWLLSSLLDPLISEKRLQFRSRPCIEIDNTLDQDSYGLFVSVKPTDFKRVISNLINNSVEAMEEAGRVAVRLARQNDGILVVIEDTGKGIPADILAKLGRSGESYGKPGGSGLGIFHARQAATAWGGKLEITSEPGKGTVARLTIPAAEPPEWFVSPLPLQAGRTVVILDDDISIHQLWQGRFEAEKTMEKGIGTLQFAAPEELRAWTKKDPNEAAQAVYLLDYELIGHKETGITLAEELGLTKRVILVTSRYEDPEVLKECSRLKIKLVPKSLAGIIPISITYPGTSSAAGRDGAPSRSAEAILLDDDPLVQMTWQMAARHKGVALKVCGTREELLEACTALPADVPVYIDSELGNGVRGEDIALTLHEKGFTVLYIESGHPREKFAGLNFLTGIRSKTPPW